MPKLYYKELNPSGEKAIVLLHGLGATSDSWQYQWDVLGKAGYRVIVPDFIVGKPTYNFANCIQYVIFRLKQNGFEVKYYYPNCLQIIWGKQSFESLLHIENDRGTLNMLAIENKPKNSPTLFDMKAPHTGENLGIFSNRKPTAKKIINLNMGTTDTPSNDDNFTIHFKGEPKESKKKQIQDQKFRAINDFIPKTNVFSNMK
jgi:hypothetical protein